MKEAKKGCPTKLTDIQEASDSVLEETPAKPKKNNKKKSVLMGRFVFVENKKGFKQKKTKQTTLNAFIKKIQRL